MSPFKVYLLLVVVLVTAVQQAIAHSNVPRYIVTGGIKEQWCRREPAAK